MKRDNLIPQAHKLTVEEQSAGGKASAEARRRRKELREDLIALLDTKLQNSAGEEKRTQEVIVTKLVNQALKGDLRAIDLISKLLGENREKHEISLPPGMAIYTKYTDEELEREIERLKK